MNSENADFGRTGEVVLNLTDEQLELVAGGCYSTFEHNCPSNSVC